MLNQAFNYVMNGAEILALHLGKYYKVDSGLRLDSGSIVKALEYATAKAAIVVGKPSIKFFKAALDDLNLDPNEVLMIGDDLDNDIYGAKRIKVDGTYYDIDKFPDLNKKVKHDISIVVDRIIINNYLGNRLA